MSHPGRTIMYLSETRPNGVRSIVPIDVLEAPPAGSTPDAPLDTSIDSVRDGLHTALSALGIPDCGHDDWEGFLKFAGEGRALVVARCARCAKKEAAGRWEGGREGDARREPAAPAR